MAFDGGLIYLYNSTTKQYDNIPLSYMFKESYKVVPNRRQDMDSGRNADGVLERNVLGHTASTIEFQTPPTWNVTIANLMQLIRSHYTNETEKKLNIRYYCPDINGYKTGDFYMPDIEYPIMRVDGNKIFYNNITFEFIEY